MVEIILSITFAFFLLLMIISCSLKKPFNIISKPLEENIFIESHIIQNQREELARLGGILHLRTSTEQKETVGIRIIDNNQINTIAESLLEDDGDVENNGGG